MKINGITTIVDLAFNLSGSLAGIPAILLQLPVGERVGFATLPELWEDVDDIGQTWTPDLGGVEVDITAEAYNPTAIQKAPYSTDIGCIERAANWGNALLDVLESGDWSNIVDIPQDTIYLDKVRVINLNESVIINASPTGSIQYFDAGTFPRSDGSSVSIVLNVLADNTVHLRFSTINKYLIVSSSALSHGLLELEPEGRRESIWYEAPNLVDDWYDSNLGLTTLFKYMPPENTVRGLKPPFDTGWAFERNIFVKIRR